jgi:hypothetical protein
LRVPQSLQATREIGREKAVNGYRRMKRLALRKKGEEIKRVGKIGMEMAFTESMRVKNACSVFL